MEKYLNTLGWRAAAVVIFAKSSSILNYNLGFSYILIFISNILWLGYGFYKPKKDWPLIIANGFAVVITLMEFIIYYLFMGFSYR